MARSIKKNTILATGSDIKNRILLAHRGDITFGPELGDLSNTVFLKKFKREINLLMKKAGKEPDAIACDLHPGYISTRFAEYYSSKIYQAPLRKIQHHHAHIASVMAEHKLNGPVIGVAFDGTGYGTDGNMWGGEFLLVDRNGFKRLAHLKYRMMPGGDKVVHEPWRMILSILGKRGIPFLGGISKRDMDIVLTMMEKGINSPLTSSAGRLFDAASALLGMCQHASYEAEGPIKLESICDGQIRGKYDFFISNASGCYIIDAYGVFEGMIKDLERGISKCSIASKYHNSISAIIVCMIKKLAKKTGLKKIALSGGVFQNKFLTQRVTRDLGKSGFRILMNSTTPINDLNIAMGQYYVCRMKRK